MRTILISFEVVLFLLFSNFVAQAASLSTLRNSSLSVPATDIAIGVATNLSGPDFEIGSVSPTTAQGGRAALTGSSKWSRAYNGGPASLQNGAYAMAVRLDGSVVVTGYSDGSGSAYDFATVCYSTDGVPLWTNRYDGGLGYDTARLVACSTNGDVWIAGESMRYPTNYTYTDAVLIKYSSNGIPSWTNRISSFETNGTYPISLLADVQGNAYFRYSGTFWSGGAFGTPVEDAIIKVDSAGNTLWARHYLLSADNSSEELHDIDSVALDKNGNLIVAGPTGFRSTITGFSIEKFAVGGAPLWTNHMAWPFVDGIYLLSVDSDGNCIAMGQRWTNSNRIYVAIKFSANGVGIWTNNLAGPSYDGGNVPQTLADPLGNVFVIGGAPGSAPAQYRMLKIGTNGMPQWTNDISVFGPTNGIIYGSASDPAGNIYVAGYARKSDSSDADFVTAKYSNNGQLMWTRKFNGSAGSDDYAFNLAVDRWGNAYLSGETHPISDPSSFATVKYVESVNYSPPANFTGLDTFSGTVFDSKGNHAPFAVDVLVVPGAFQFNSAAMQMNGSGMRLRVDGAPGTNGIVLEGSTDLVDWQIIQTNAPIGSTVQFLDASALQNPSKYYRVHQQQ